MSVADALEVEGLTSGYGEAMVLRGVSLRVPPGEVLAVLGKNGMGKSTLLRTIMGFLPVRAGHIRIDGQETTGLAPHRMVGRRVAFSPQDQAIFQDLTVDENLRLGARGGEYAAGFDRVCGFFPFLGQRRRQRAGTLSGGEQKMLLMARALLARPKLMLIDEITEGLQPLVIRRLAEVLRAEVEAERTGVLLIEQNVQFALSVARKYAVLTRGEIVDRGEAGPDAGARIAAHLSV